MSMTQSKGMPINMNISKICLNQVFLGHSILFIILLNMADILCIIVQES